MPIALLEQPELKITACFNGRYISRSEMDKWMIHRLRIAEKKLGFKPMPKDKPSVMLEKLTDEKLALSHEDMMKKLGREISICDKVLSLMIKLAHGRTKSCITVMDVEGLDLDTFLKDYEELQTVNSPENLKANIGVSPDHYYLGVNQKNELEVIENCGNNLMVSQFFITYNNEQGLNSSREADTYERQSMGHAVFGSGKIGGGVRHQFRKTPNGFQAKLLVEFPALIPQTIINSHQVHLALEFSNWVKYVATHRSNFNNNAL
jgi:cyclophilin family peptidyl-prolyl cis-trans isomerase